MKLKLIALLVSALMVGMVSTSADAAVVHKHKVAVHKVMKKHHHRHHHHIRHHLKHIKK